MFFKKTKVAAVATTEAASIQTAAPRSAKRQKGFTLLELGFVVGLISIIVGGFAVYQSTDNAKATRAYADLMTIKDAALRFQADTGANTIRLDHLWSMNSMLMPGHAYSQNAISNWAGPYMNPTTIRPGSQFPLNEGDEDVVGYVKLSPASEINVVYKHEDDDELITAVHSSGRGNFQALKDSMLHLSHVPEGVAKLMLAKCDSSSNIEISGGMNHVNVLTNIYELQSNCGAIKRGNDVTYDFLMLINIL